MAKKKAKMMEALDAGVSEPTCTMCKDKVGFVGDPRKCVCVAYEKLRASQELFFKKPVDAQEEDCQGFGIKVEDVDPVGAPKLFGVSDGSIGLLQNPRFGVSGGSVVPGQKPKFGDSDGLKDNFDLAQNPNLGVGDGLKGDVNLVQNPKLGDLHGSIDQVSQLGTTTKQKRDLHGSIDQVNQLGTTPKKPTMRERLLDNARGRVPEPGSGRVSHLVKAFESLLTVPKGLNGLNLVSKDEKSEEDASAENVMRWPSPGMQSNSPEPDEFSSSSCPSELLLTSEKNLMLGVASSWDSTRESLSSRASSGIRSRRNSSGSSGTSVGRKWRKRQLRVTSLKPFKLRTDQRGRCKEEEFIKKVQEMMIEEEKRRIPIAQGLPWTTDEPECLIKPPVKDPTRPLDVKLHSDVRAIERADFDHQVAEKMTLIELYKLERERQRQMEEEEEIRRLRKELIPKAQPMPYFDQPFIPKRSMKHPTIPREPKFHIPHHQNKLNLSWNSLDFYDQQQQ